jgi:hypothetical protein
MDDLDIAKDLLAMILGVEIIEISVKPQETTGKTTIDNQAMISIYRLDFVAIIKEKNLPHKKILIELQKSKRNTNIARFRKYLAESYIKEDKIVINGVEMTESLEIVTLYFLGFELADVPTSVLKIKNTFVDATTGQNLPTAPTDPFARLLNHESYIVQIPKLKPNDQSRVENVLSIFSQNIKNNDEHKLNYDETQATDPLTKRIVNRLLRAIADDNLQRIMNVEDEIEQNLIEIEEKVKKKFDIALLKSKKTIEKNKKTIKAKDQEIEAKDQEIEALKKLLANKNNQ